MKRLFLLVAALCGLAAPAAFAQTQPFYPGAYLVVSSCGSPTYTANDYRIPTMDTTGKACGSGSGGGGGAITAASGAYASGSIASGAEVSGGFTDLVTSGTPCASASTASCRLADIVAYNAQVAAASIASGSNVIGKVGIDQTTPGTTNQVSVSGQNDPCFASTKSYADFESTSSGGSIITAVSAKKAYVCSISVVTSTAANVSIVEGTGASVCTGGTTAGDFLNTGTTAANGASFAANGGIQTGAGMGTVFANATANQNTCVVFTTTNSPQVNVHVSYVQQ